MERTNYVFKPLKPEIVESLNIHINKNKEVEITVPNNQDSKDLMQLYYLYAANKPQMSYFAYLRGKAANKIDALTGLKLSKKQLHPKLLMIEKKMANKRRNSIING